MKKTKNVHTVKWFYLAAILTVAAIIFLVVFQIYPEYAKKDCTTRECLVPRAEKCLPTIMNTVEENMQFTYEITTNCNMIISTTSINEAGAKEFLPKKTCSYEKDRFMETIIESDTFPCISE